MIKHISITLTAIIALALTALILMLPTPENTASEDSGSETFITNVQLMQDGKILKGQTILIEDGLIEKIGAGLEPADNSNVIDGTGLTALPGLIDSHTHSYGSSLEDALKFGVTVNMDMFSDFSALTGARSSRDAFGKQDEADLFSAGMMATAPGGHGTQYGVPIKTLTGPEQARDWVKERKREGSDYIKLVYIPGQDRIPSLSRETSKAVIEAAHAEDLMALAHISTELAAQHMIEDGIDGLVHIFADKRASAGIVQAARDNNVFIIPTLAVIASVDGQSKNLMDGLPDAMKSRMSPMQRQTLSAAFPGGGRGYSYATALENVALFHNAGVPILAGSDAPNPGTAHGVSLHLEMKHLVEAGHTPAEALAAATALPARIFSLEKRGDIQTGYRADLILVSGDPHNQIDDTLDVAHIFKNGFELSVAPKKAAVKAGRKKTESTLSDFENGLTAKDGLTWITTDDGMANGLSDASIVLENNALKTTGEVRTGFPYPWAGAAVGTEFGGKGLDISGYDKIRFSMKGTPGQYRLMSFQEGMPGIPPTQVFTVTEDWQDLELPLDGFAGFEPEIFTGFAFVAGPTPGSFEFYLRDVTLK